MYRRNLGSTKCIWLTILLSFIVFFLLYIKHSFKILEQNRKYAAKKEDFLFAEKVENYLKNGHFTKAQKSAKLDSDTTEKATSTATPTTKPTTIPTTAAIPVVTHPVNKRILIYSTLFGNELWPDMNLEQIGTFMQRCEYKQCEITYDKREIMTADVALFHGVDVKNDKRFTSDILRNASRFRRADQKWVMFIQESPKYYDDFSAYTGLFNWLMSYKATSDVVNPYGYYQSTNMQPHDGVVHSQGKDLLGIWLASNCVPWRNEYMFQLSRHIPLTVGGACAQNIFNRSSTCASESAECERFVKRHKFYFSFENCFCDYYVTEKYWQKGIDWGLVPVVMGARYDVTNVIPASYIDASKFDSIKQLADYLLYLHGNDTAYNEYFTWKRQYKRVGLEKMCELCKHMHTVRWRDEKVYENIWSSQQDCSSFLWKKDRVWQQIQQSKNT